MSCSILVFFRSGFYTSLGYYTYNMHKNKSDSVKIAFF